MLKLRRHKQFLKDFKKQTIPEKHYAKFVIYLAHLLKHEPLPPEALDHPLRGEWSDTREFHTSGDLLVIYAIREETLDLYRMGTHSELFE